MRIVPGDALPEYALPDHENVPRRLGELRGDDPMVLMLARAHPCPGEHHQHLDLAANDPEIAVAYASETNGHAAPTWAAGDPAAFHGREKRTATTPSPGMAT